MNASLLKIRGLPRASHNPTMRTPITPSSLAQT
ncbi:hypothetical protein BBOMB_1585 [Bifidobacterium bombi DSM 19703]|uniref:Uncharacterized protein n=1 Tax=Bifidobacterium bombi DSM 19703 TaxID=1341695 RepID=A0A086BNE3_9BIFI|nr:hypothetical protein BBOMB_1585 [Bifidobacterium bombi DSM 19703]